MLTLLFEAAETLQLLLLFGAVHAASRVTAAPQSRRTAPGNRSSPSPDGVRQAPVLPGGGGGRRPPGQIPGAGVTAPSAHARPSSRDASSEHVRKTRRRQPRVRPKRSRGFRLARPFAAGGEAEAKGEMVVGLENCKLGHGGKSPGRRLSRNRRSSRSGRVATRSWGRGLYASWLDAQPCARFRAKVPLQRLQVGVVISSMVITLCCLPWTQTSTDG